MDPFHIFIPQGSGHRSLHCIGLPLLWREVSQLKIIVRAGGLNANNNNIVANMYKVLGLYSALW